MLRAFIKSSSKSLSLRRSNKTSGVQSNLSSIDIVVAISFSLSQYEWVNCRIVATRQSVRSESSNTSIAHLNAIGVHSIRSSCKFVVDRFGMCSDFGACVDKERKSW